jgi:hypothetical protein
MAMKAHMKKIITHKKYRYAAIGIIAVLFIAVAAFAAVGFYRPQGSKVVDAQTVASTVTVGVKVYNQSVQVDASPNFDQWSSPIYAPHSGSGVPHGIYINSSAFSQDFRVGLKICMNDGSNCHEGWTPWASDVANGVASTDYSPVVAPGPYTGGYVCGAPQITAHDRLGIVSIAAQYRSLPPSTSLKNVELVLHPLEWDYDVPVDLNVEPTCAPPNEGTDTRGYTMGGWSNDSFDKWNNASTDGFELELQAGKSVLGATLVSENLPRAFNVGQKIATGTDGNPIRVVVKNTGTDAWSSTKGGVVGAPVGTCDVDTDGDGVPDAPAAIPANYGATCTVSYNYSSSLFLLDHKAGVLAMDPGEASYVKVVPIITTYFAPTKPIRIKTCTPSGSGPTQPAQPSSAMNKNYHIISTAYAAAMNCTTETEPGDPAGYEASAGVSADVAPGDTATFTIDSLTAPATPGSSVEVWQMKDDYFGDEITIPTTIGVPAGSPTIKVTPVSQNITLGASAPLTVTSVGAKTCAETGDWSDSQCNGTITVTPKAAGTFTYTATANNAAGIATATATITVACSGPSCSPAVAATGTINVVSENTLTTNPVSSTWWAIASIDVPNMDICSLPGASCSGVSQTYGNLSTNNNVVMVQAIPGSAGSLYALRGVEERSDVAIKKSNDALSNLFAFSKSLLFGVAKAVDYCDAIVPAGGQCSSSNLGVNALVLSSSAPTADFTILWDPVAVMNVTPMSLSFDASGALSGPVTITNNGAPGSELDWTADTTSTWLSPSAASGAVMNGTPQSITLTADPSGLSAGTTYHATVNINGANAKNGTPYCPVGLLKAQCDPSSSVDVSLTIPAPTVTISPTSGTITLGDSQQFTIASANAKTCAETGDWSDSQCSGTITVTPTTTGTFTYNVTAKNDNGSASASATLTVTPPPASPTVTISPVSNNISFGSSQQFTITSTNAKTCKETGDWSGSQCSGTITVTPAHTGTFTYGVVATNDNGSAAVSATLKVYTGDPPGCGTSCPPPGGGGVSPTVTISPASKIITLGSSQKFTITSTNAKTCKETGDWSGTQCGGTITVTPTSVGTFTYGVSAANDYGNASISTTLTVTTTGCSGSSCPPPTGGTPSCALSAAPSSIAPGQSAKLSYSCTDVSSCYISGGAFGTYATVQVSGSTASGSKSVSPTSNTIYALSCDGAAANASVQITVTNPGLNETNP